MNCPCLHSPWFRLGLLLGVWLMAARPAGAETLILYGNDFETPNVTPAATCATLDPRGINVLYGSADFVFNQVNTVEAVLVEVTDAAGTRTYADPEMKGGKYTLGMLSTVQDDLLSLTFDAKKLPFLNIGMDLSSIEVPGCGGPFGVAIPRMKLSLLDSPGGTFAWSQTVLSETTVEGVMAPDGFTFAWKRVVAALDASKSTDGHVSVVFNLEQSGYAAFDNLSITASTTASVIDTDLDGKPDDDDNCRMMKNLDQANQDKDKAGDVCDPAPTDPTVCGDLDGDGQDDCAGGATTDGGADGPRARSGNGCHCGVGEPARASALLALLLGGLPLLRRRRARQR